MIVFLEGILEEKEPTRVVIITKNGVKSLKNLCEIHWNQIGFAKGEKIIGSKRANCQIPANVRRFRSPS